MDGMDCVIFVGPKRNAEWFWAVEGDKCVILLMAEILHQLIGSLSKCL